MDGAIHELRACGMRLLEPLELIGELTIASRRYRVPSRICRESTVKQVETSQIRAGLKNLNRTISGVSA
jgi:hypothetical protein